MITINYYDLWLQKIHMTIKTESREIKMGEKMTPEQFVKKGICEKITLIL